MFPHIKTSKENREVVAKLTQRLNLGTENIIARIALSYSLSKNKKLKIEEIKNSGGKEYAKEVLLGKYADYYLGMVALHYSVHISDQDLPKYVKLHIDDGLELINKEIQKSPNIDGFDYITAKIAGGLEAMAGKL